MTSPLKWLLDRMPMARSTSAYDFGLELLDLPPAARLLDLGTGRGISSAYLSRRLPDARVFTVDVNLGGLERDQLDMGVHPPVFLQATALHLPLANDSLDAVLAVMTFHCLPEPEQVMAEVARVLRPGGVFLLADVDGEHWMARPFEWVEHLGISSLTHAYTVDELRALADAVGLADMTVYRRSDKSGFMMWVLVHKNAQLLKDIAKQDEREQQHGRV